MSNTGNKFTAVDSDIVNNVMNGSCSGIGCCQTSIPMGATNFQITLSSYSNHSNALGFNPCSYASVAKETAYNFFSLDLKDFQEREKLPVVFDWEVDSYEGDGMKNGTGCNPIPVPDHRLPLINISLGIRISISMLLLCCSWLYLVFRQRKIINLREKFFEQNDGIMLQQQLSKCEGSVLSAKIVTAEDLRKATNNYHESRVLGQGGQGTVYKGRLSDNTIVAIKKSKVADQSQTRIEQFINEVISPSQVNFTNVVKLLGQQVLNNMGESSKDSNRNCNTLSYLHSAASTPIIDGDVKSTNILLNAITSLKYLILELQLTTLVQGTLGYLDPEYFHTSQLTEKSSFGVVLVELLTGKKALSFNRPEVMNEAKADQLKKVSILAKRCLNVKGNEWPTMKEVAMELEGLRMMEKHPWVDDNKNLETQYLLGDQLSDTYGSGTRVSNSRT
ncbi:hypothetical protein TEA_026109 [Camellia sinensis var. sinensis]|uniref:Protein kinase domain-containing protein n=1 Tax=Camellia sinensis var. sinensis TaxID=542762 RepID=A0A4S4EKD0_CAMSN|nr:hypothetical protein TEA_026109 [Camellia sinensis var. sinensis]